MSRFCVAAFLILTFLLPCAEGGLFSRKKQPGGARYGVSRGAQAKRAEKAQLQRQRNRDKQRTRQAASQRSKGKPVEVRVKSTPVDSNQ
ncbi:MAG: hypothetical protein JNK48_28585 [Bryobacterales bacterium]|nr:hypothetical protein [Bryobacterales bacterium]